MRVGSLYCGRWLGVSQSSFETNLQKNPLSQKESSSVIAWQPFQKNPILDTACFGSSSPLPPVSKYL